MPYAASSSRSIETPSKPRHVDIAFDVSYAPSATFVQRLAVEPRVPKLEGVQFVSEADAEKHNMVLALLLRPLYLPPCEDFVSQSARILATYKQLCTAPDGEDPWPALPSNASGPGPFERSMRGFLQQQESLAGAARRKSCSLCTV